MRIYSRLGCAVLIFDNRGIGGSHIHPEREAEEYRTEDLAKDVEELIKV